MARIRTIKPEFFTSEDILELSPLARLFFISLWCEADREGRLRWKLRTLKYRYLPADDCDIEQLSDELIDNNLIEIYVIDGQEYCQIPGFTRHQSINNRESASEIPEKPTFKAPKPRASDASGTRESGVKAEGKGREGKGREGEKNTSHLDEPNDDQQTAEIHELPKQKNCPYQEIVNLYHEALPELPKVQKLTDTRKGYIRQRWQEDLPDMDHWKNFFTFIRKSDFLMGRTPGRNGGPPFRADIEWITKPANFVKISEDKYHGQQQVR